MHYVDIADADDFPNVSEHNKLNRHMNLPSFNIHIFGSIKEIATENTETETRKARRWKQISKARINEKKRENTFNDNERRGTEILFSVVFCPKSY